MVVSGFSNLSQGKVCLVSSPERRPLTPVSSQQVFKMLLLTEYLLCVSYYGKHFTCMISVSSQ